ncbi:MAG: hypothetical protein WAM14_02110 [Candidatus Nitrosopolaris sp.]
MAIGSSAKAVTKQLSDKEAVTKNGAMSRPLGYCLLRYSWSLEVSTSNTNSKSQTAALLIMTIKM